MDLHQQLLELRLETAPERRAEVSGRLVGRLQWVRGHLARRHADASRSQVERAFDVLVERLARGGLGYRGERGESSARAFVRRSAHRKLADVRRRDRGEEKAERKAHPHGGSGLLGADHEHKRQAANRVMHALRVVLADCRPKVCTRVELALEHRLQRVSGWDQAVRHGLLPANENDPLARRRARWLVDQDRRRGKKHLLQILRQLVARGRVSAADARHFCELLELPEEALSAAG